MLPWYFCYITA